MVTQAEIQAASAYQRVKLSGRAIMPSDPKVMEREIWSVPVNGICESGIGSPIYKIVAGNHLARDCKRWDEMGRIIDSVEPIHGLI